MASTADLEVTWQRCQQLNPRTRIRLPSAGMRRRERKQSEGAYLLLLTGQNHSMSFSPGEKEAFAELRSGWGAGLSVQVFV